jgi:hypothetical protein
VGLKNLAAICEPNVSKSWEPQPLTTLRASTACATLPLPVSSTDVSYQRLLIVEILQLPAFKSVMSANIPQLYCMNELLHDWRLTANQFVLAPGPLRPMSRYFIFQPNSCCSSPYITSSLRRRLVCLLWIRLTCCQMYISHI